MIFQPNEYHSGPNSSDNAPFRGYHETPGSLARYSTEPDRGSFSPASISNRLPRPDGMPHEPWASSTSDAISTPRTLRLVIAGVQHRGEAVLTDIIHEYPTLRFVPTPRHVAFRAALLEATKPSAEFEPAPHPLIRHERVHRALGVALSNLVARATKAPLQELSCDDGEPILVSANDEMNEYLASAWAVRSFIRVATTEPEMFRILVTEMSAIHSGAGRLSLGVPMSPLMVYELFNAAARNPELSTDVVKAFQLIGYRGEVGERLFREFSAALERQISEAS